MNETITRLISGVVYAALLLLAIFISEYTFVVLIFAFGLIALFELQNLLNLHSYLTYILFAVLLVVFNIYQYFEIKPLVNILMISALLIDILLIRDLLTIRKIPIFEGRKYLIVVFYLLAALTLLTLIPFQNPDNQYEPKILLGIFILIWSNDTFAYLIGKSIGKRKLFERISPNKTVEGFLGGAICTMGISYLLFHFTQIYTYPVWLGLALITCLFGTFGDLIESKFKRQAGIKDSGKIMPGHGGLLDRLDSIIFASVFIFSFLAIVNNVS